MKLNVIKLTCLKRKIIFNCFFAISIFLSIPLLFILLLPIFVLRILVSRLSKVLRPDLGKMLTALSCVFASDDFTTNPKWTFLHNYTIKGSVDIHMLKSKLVEKVIGIRKVDSDMKNIELKQYPYKWMGFLFWKWDEDFNISNHVRYYENKLTQREAKISKERLNEIKQELLFQPYPEERSPWEIIIIQNVQSNNEGEDTVLAFKLHHSICDGYSLLKLLCFEIMDEAPKELVHSVVFPKLGIVKRMLSNLKIVKLPYEMAECIVESYGKNDWKIQESERSNKYFEVAVDHIPMSFIKDLTKELSTSVNSVLLSAVTAGFRHSMLKQQGRVPHHLHIALPFPRDGHPDKLRNFCAGILVKLPMGENDPLRRLKKIERSLKKLKKSYIPLISVIISTSVGCMFHWMIRPVATATMFSSMTAIGSLFPGPKGKLTIFGQENVDMDVSGRPQFGSFGFNFYSTSYCNHLNMKFIVNENILTKKTDVEEMVSIVLQELHVLKQFCCTTA